MLNMVLLDTEKIPHKYSQSIQERLRQFGNLVSYITTAIDEVIPRCKDAEIILVNKNILTKEHLQNLPNLKYIVVIATGYNNIDTAGAYQYGIKVSNLPTYGATMVAQHTLALLLELTNQVGRVNYMIKHKGKWGGTGHKHLELLGLTLGVIGFGNIAKAVIKIALAFGMKVLVNATKSNYETDLAVKFVDRETLFKNSDVISLHCTLNGMTANIINIASLSLMKPNCLLINTSRGGLINEADLHNALLNKQIKGAALDVLNQEPVAEDNPLLELDNCLFSPHNAWISDASLDRWQDDIISCIEGYLDNKLINLVEYKSIR